MSPDDNFKGLCGWMDIIWLIIVDNYLSNSKRESRHMKYFVGHMTSVSLNKFRQRNKGKHI